jgi:hypothetical protein
VPRRTDMTRLWPPLWAAGACATYLSFVLLFIRVLPRSNDDLPPWARYDPDDDDAWLRLLLQRSVGHSLNRSKGNRRSESSTS